MPKSKLHKLSELGQSLWLDFISRDFIKNGKIKEFISQGVRGMTSNPTIFQKVISSSSEYDETIAKLHQKFKSSFEIYDDLTTSDIRDAADLFQPVYENSQFLDGYVSLEVNPHLAFDAKKSIDEGKRLSYKVGRDNLMVKVPATPAGYVVIEELTALGINVNATLIFSVDQYAKTASAYCKGLKRLSKTRQDVNQVRSVASVFVSRVDSTIDKMLDERILHESRKGAKSKLKDLKGKAAVANATLIFEKYREIFSSEKFMSLLEFNAAPQRVLWASTGTKNSDYSDIKYVSELIANPTVNTLPEATLNAFIDHGEPKVALPGNVKDAQKTIKTLMETGINVDQVCEVLLEDGLKAFDASFDNLLLAVDKKAKALSVRL